MKKIICILSALALAVSLSACGKGTEKTDNSSADTSAQECKTVNLTELKNNIIAQTGITDAMDIPTESLGDLYGIDAADVVSSACCSTLDGTFPVEILMIEAKDSAASEKIVAALNTRLDDVKTQSQNYDAENYALAQTCKILTQGNYVALFIAAEHEKMETMFNDVCK